MGPDTVARRSSTPTPPRLAGRVSYGDRIEGLLAFDGSQFTSPRFTELLIGAGVTVSMDGRGRWLDPSPTERFGVFIERLWRSLTYDCVYLYAFETGSEARTGIGKWLTDYSAERPHSALGGRTPDEAHAGNDGIRLAA